MPAQGGFPLALFAFVALWVLVFNLIGYSSGWWSLAKAYRHRGKFDGKIRNFHNLRVGTCNYGNMSAGTNAHGLYLAAFIFFRPGHPPLFIPWTDVAIQIVRGWFWRNYLEMSFERVPGVRLQIPEKYGKEPAADANLAWDRNNQA